MITLINYANGQPYEKFRKWNSWSAKHLGRADRIIEYTIKDIPQSYVNKHKNIFDYGRGAGLWLWKPYIILDALSKIEEGEWLFYCDSGTVIIRNLRYLVKCAERITPPLCWLNTPY